jgi:hypothetical protein
MLKDLHPNCIFQLSKGGDQKNFYKDENGVIYEAKAAGQIWGRSAEPVTTISAFEVVVVIHPHPCVVGTSS